MQKAQLIPSLVYNLWFSNDFSYIRLLDENAHILLILRCSVPDQCIYINDQTRTGAWGERSFISLPPEGSPDRLSLHIKVENQLELWNSTQNTQFSRFTRETAGRVKYCIMRNAESEDGELMQTFKSVDVMTSEVANQVAMRRIDKLERQLGALLSTNVNVGN